MKILIADDNIYKQDILNAYIKNKFPDADISQSYSFNSTRKQIFENVFSLILLDMTMPTFDSNDKSATVSESRNRPLAGKEIISSMAYRKLYSPVILVTQFEVFGRHNQLTSIDDIFDEINGLYPDIIKGSVLFDFQSDSWKSKLDNFILNMELK
ncbi:hypothetical protein RM768_003474 [Enterobacter asburiae]|nr:hypothetical protein [Enterobacter asburiae]